MKYKESNILDEIETKVLHERLETMRDEVSSYQEKLNKSRAKLRQQDMAIIELQDMNEKLRSKIKDLDRERKKTKKEIIKNRQLEKTVENLKNKIDNLKTENKFYESRHNHLDTKFQNYQKDAENKTKALVKSKEDAKDKLFEQKIAFDVEILSLKDTNITLEKEIEHLRATIQVTKTEMLDWCTKLSLAKEDNNEKTKLISQLEENIEKLTKSNQKQEHEYKLESENLKNLLNDTKMMKSLMKEQIDEWQTKFSNQKEELKETNQTIEILTEEIQAKKTELNNQNLTIEMKNTEIEKTKSLLQNKEYLLIITEDEKNSLKERLDLKIEDIVMKEREIDSLNTKLILGNQKIGNLEMEKTEISKQLSMKTLDFNDKESELKQSLKSARLTISEKNIQNQSQKNTIETMDQELKELRGLPQELTASKVEIIEKSNLIANLKQNISNLKIAKNQLEEERDSYQKKYLNSDQNLLTLEGNYLKIQQDTTKHQLELQHARIQHNCDMEEIFDIVKIISNDLNKEKSIYSSLKPDRSLIQHELYKIKALVRNLQESYKLYKKQYSKEKEDNERKQNLKKLEWDIDRVVREAQYEQLREQKTKLESETYNLTRSLNASHERINKMSLEKEAAEIEKKAEMIERSLRTNFNF